MIMAPSASHRQTHEGLANGIQLLIDDIHVHFYRVIFSKHLGANHQEARCNHAIMVIGL